MINFFDFFKQNDPLKIVKSKVDNLMKVKSKNRNFSIKCEDGDIILLKNNNRLSLKSEIQKFFPHFSGFIKNQSFSANYFASNITYNKNNVNSKLFFLSIFHELGHIFDSTLAEEKLKLNSSGNTYEEIKLKEIDRESRSERRAWAIALKLLDFFEKKGFNIKDGLTNDEITRYINLCLQTYKIFHGQQHTVLFTKKKLTDLL